MTAVDERLEPLLEIDEIQGNILGGFNKDHQAILALRFAGDDAAIGAVRRWLLLLIPRITWAREVVQYKNTRRDVIGRTGAEPYMPVVWKNIAFTHRGLAKLTPTADQFTDVVFRAGLDAAASARLGDPVTIGKRGHISTWVVGKPGEEPDMLLIIAADDADQLAVEVQMHMASATAAGIVCSPCDVGHDLAHFTVDGVAFPRGREHFGFKDGISQPGIRGRTSADADIFLTPRIAGATSPDPDEPEFAQPGQPLICAGEFVLGYPRQSEASPRRAVDPMPLASRDGASDPRAVAPWWARNGSFLVFRRLAQDVPAFNRFLASEAGRLATLPDFSGITEDALGALLVGRWRSGAPILRTPQKDNPDLGKATPANNAFDYAQAADPADGFGSVPEDPLALTCPAAAHIRKVNPRAMSTDLGAPTRTLTRRILRRGIPFGPPLPIGTTAEEPPQERGLLFLCYQASIAEQFEFLSANWANDTAKPFALSPPGGSGHDMIIGQAGDSLERFCLIGAAMEPVRTSERWVTATGGGYFFAPSKTALTTVLSRDS